MSKSCSGKINKTRYDDPRKPMKPISFTVKNLGGNLPEKQSTIVKRSFRSSTKPVPRLYNPRRWTYSRNLLLLQSLWTLQYMNATLWCTNPSTWLTNCADPSMWLNHQLEKIVGCKVLHFINNEDQEALGYKTLRRKDAVTSFKENKASVTFCICSLLYSLMWRPLK